MSEDLKLTKQINYLKFTSLEDNYQLVLIRKIFSGFLTQYFRNPSNLGFSGEIFPSDNQLKKPSSIEKTNNSISLIFMTSFSQNHLKSSTGCAREFRKVRGDHLSS